MIIIHTYDAASQWDSTGKQGFSQPTISGESARNKKLMKPMAVIITPGIINDKPQSIGSKLLATTAPTILPTDV